MKAIYKDAIGEIHTQIINQPTESGKNLLSMQLNGVRFEGYSFDDFNVVNPSNYSSQQLARFYCNNYMTYDLDYKELCNCTLSVWIPIVLIHTINQKTTPTLLKMSLRLGAPTKNGGIDYEMASFRLTIKDRIYESKGEDFEIGLDQLFEQLASSYHFKNCYGCLYSDYSPYGVGFFNSMLCFKQKKDAYLALNNNFSKADYLNLIDSKIGFIQEIDFCNEFEVRKKGTGYRG